MEKKKFDLLIGRVSRLKGEVKAPASKSYTNRAIIIGALGNGIKIVNPLICEDTLAAIGAIRKLGALVRVDEGRIIIKGLNGNIKGSSINVGESGTLLRLILPILALGKSKFRVEGKGSLLNRPNTPLAECLLSMGVNIRGRDKEYRLPIIIEGKGMLPGGKISVSGRLSSQVISSLLNVSAFAKVQTRVTVTDRLVSRPYVDITIDLLSRLGIKVEDLGRNKFIVPAGQLFKKGVNFKVHGDYSSAAFLIAAGCLLESDITITDLAKDKQGDREFINILNRMGARIKYQSRAVKIEGPYELKGININSSDTPDLVPILCAIGCFAKGTTRITDIKHLAFKESNRIEAPVKELKRLGADIKVSGENIVIRQSVLKSARVNSSNDHRIAMALAVAALKTGNVRIEGAQCINKSYPRFIPDIRHLGAVIKKI